MELNSVSVEEVPDYMLSPLEVEDLKVYVEDVKRRMALMALPEEAAENGRDQQ